VTPAVPVASLSPVISRPNRIDQIDVLRGLSILAVIVHHINLRIRIDKTLFGSHLPPVVIQDLGWNGYNGVIVFFAVSGFLITSMSLRRWGALDGIRLRDFYRLRFARIAPCLLALLAVLSLLHLLRVAPYTIHPERASLPRALVAALTFHVNWLEAARGYLPANWDVLWSLSVEEVFYLFFPIACLLTRSRKALVPLLAVFVTIGPFARTVFTHNQYWADNGYLSCMDAIALGCLAAIFSEAYPLGSAARNAIKWSGAGLVAFATLCKPWVNAIGLYQHGVDVSAIALGTALMLICFGQERKQGSWATGWLRWFGRNSYEIYLTHMMAIFALLPVANRFGSTGQLAPFWYLVMIAAAGVLGAAIARYFSEPLNRKLRSSAREAEARLSATAATT
jgi:peptidoglycan/LPS O-acetylase OafA/YrhL